MRPVDDSWDTTERCAPDSAEDCAARIAMVQGDISLPEAIALVGFDEVIRIMGMDK